jgi:hypothetical protein
MLHVASKYIAKFGIWILLTTFLIVGIVTYKKYGVSCDEQQQRLIGTVNWNYISGLDDALLDFGDRYYGPLWEMVLLGFEKALNVVELKDIFYLRHFLGNLLFIISGLFFFYIIKTIVNNRIISLIFTLIYLTQPELYAHSFFNSKDIVFMSFMVITAFFWLNQSKKQETWCKYRILFFVLAGLTASLRLIGGVWIVLYSVTILLDKKSIFKSINKYSITYLSIFSLSLFVAWPVLWQNPFKGFYWGIFTMLHFGFGDLQLFDGKWFLANELPWYYIPKYLFLKNSEILVLSSCFLFFNIIRFKKAHYKAFLNPKDLMIYFWILFPLVLVIFANSTLYNGWRHFYFIFPFVLFLLSKWFKYITLSFSFFFPLLLSIVGIHQIFIIIKLFPNSHLYFNNFSGNSVYKKYEMDYWGLTFNDAYHWIMTQEEGKVTVYNREVCGDGNYHLLNNSLKNRLCLSETIDQVDFTIVQSRTILKDSAFVKIHSLRYDDVPILDIYKRLKN